LRTLGEQREWRQQDEILNQHQDGADDTCEGSRDSQIGLPESFTARTPEMQPVALGRHANELRQRVVHVKRFVVENFLEYRTRRKITLEHVAIDTETARGSLFREMKERQHRVV
jgi:hypothetical protein